MSEKDSDEVSESIDKLEARKEYLTTWLGNFHSAESVAPDVASILESTDWQLNALRNRPEEAAEIKFPVSPDEFDRENHYIENVLPQPYRYNINLALRSTSGSYSATADMYEYVSRVGDLGTENAVDYAHEYKTSYLELQVKQNRPQQVRELLEKLNSSGVLERFDRAYTAYKDYRVNPEKRTAAANDMRNLLYGVKGDLLERAQRWPKENMTWKTMCIRFSSGGENGFAYTTLMKLDGDHSSLIDRLPDVLKDREGGAVTNLDDIWVQLLDHLYSVLGLLDFEIVIPKRT